MKNKRKTREQLLKEIEVLRERIGGVMKSKSERKKADKALIEAREQLEAQTWGLKKTNETIKLLYKELEEKNQELQKLDQLKSDFVSTVSHELRTPLAITKEGVSLVLDEVPGKLVQKQKDILSMSKDNIDRLAALINDLLDISKIEAGKVRLKKSLTDICGMVKDMSSRWKLGSDKRSQDLIISTPDTQINIYLDQGKIIQILNNLISNAIKYTPEKGKIKVQLKDKKDGIEIVVADSGIGIPQEDLPKVFGKFQQFGRTAGPGAKGTGLGLAIVKELVEMHGGTIKVESKVDKGTKFIFSLPKMETEEIFKEYINNEMREATSEKVPLSLLVPRVVKFDQLIKELGNDKAYNFLKECERLIKDCLRRQSDMVVRGKGELLVLLINTTKEDVVVVKERIEKVISNYLSKGKEKWLNDIRINIGSATYPDDAESDDELLSKCRTVE